MQKGLFCLLATVWLLGVGGGLRPAQAAPNSSPSIGESISETFKSGFKKLSDVLTPEPVVQPAEDPTSLSTPAKASPDLYASMGLLAEQRSNFAEAERCYQQALKLDPKHLGTLLAYARLQDRRNRFDEAVRLYQQAAQAHPNQATVFNDLGLCYARRHRLQEAIVQLEQAVRLKPDEVRYRNNIATVLVELGNVERAFQHLLAAHGEAVAYYNLGYLLEKKGQTQAATVLFAKALEKNPGLSEARIWLERLGGAPTAVASHPNAPAAPQPNYRNVDVTEPRTRPLPPSLAARPSPVPTAPAAARPGAVVPNTTIPQAMPPRTATPAGPSEVRHLPPVPDRDAQPMATNGHSTRAPGEAEDAPMPPPLGSEFARPYQAPSRAQPLGPSRPDQPRHPTGPMPPVPSEPAPLPPSGPLSSFVHPLPPVEGAALTPSPQKRR